MNCFMYALCWIFFFVTFNLQKLGNYLEDISRVTKPSCEFISLNSSYAFCRAVKTVHYSCNRYVDDLWLAVVRCDWLNDRCVVQRLTSPCFHQSSSSLLSTSCSVCRLPSWTCPTKLHRHTRPGTQPILSPLALSNSCTLSASTTQMHSMW